MKCIKTGKFYNIFSILSDIFTIFLTYFQAFLQQFYKIYKLNPANKSKKEKTIQNFPLWTVTIFDRFLSFFRHKAETHEKIVAKVAAHQMGTAERDILCHSKQDLKTRQRQSVNFQR